MTSYVIADFDTEDGLDLLREAVESLVCHLYQPHLCYSLCSRHSKGPDSPTRIGFLHNPANTDDLDAVQPTISRLLSHLHTQGLFTTTSPSELLTAVGFTPLSSIENDSQAVLTKESVTKKLTKGDSSKGDASKGYRDYVISSSLVARKIGLGPGQQALIVNGRVSPILTQGFKSVFKSLFQIVGPFSRGDIVADDLNGLVSFELKKRTQPVIDALRSVYPAVELGDKDTYADIVAMATSIISTTQLPDPDQSALMNAQPRFRRRGYLLLEGDHT